MNTPVFDNERDKIFLMFNGDDLSTTITDESGKAWTASGNAKLTTSDKVEGASSLVLAASGDYVSTPDSADFDLGTGDFTIDFRVNRGSSSGGWFWMGGFENGVFAFGFAVAYDYVVFNFGADQIWSDAEVATGSWMHLAFVRSGNTIMSFVEGVKQEETAKTSDPIMTCGSDFTIGKLPVTGNGCIGKYDAFRFTKGIARWTSNFNPDEIYPQNIVLPSLDLDGTAEVQTWQISSTITLPSLSIDGDLAVRSGASMVGVLPAIRGGYTIDDYVVNPVGFSGAYAENKIPPLRISASASYTPPVSLVAKIPAVKLTASAIQDHIAELAKTIPAVRISASAHQDGVASLNKPIPAIKLTASATAGHVASLEQSIGVVKLTASAFWSMPASLDTSLPPVRLTAHAFSIVDGVREDFEVLSFNPKVMGLTKYKSYEFNSMCMFNGKPVGAKADGIYELLGDDDDGDTIYWKIRLGKLDFVSTKIQNIFLSGKSSDDIILTVEQTDGTAYEYHGESVSADEGGMRIKVGKGLQSGRGYSDRYLTLELANEVQCDITIDSITVFALNTSVKR